MKYLKFFVLIICLTSCDYFEKKKVNTQDIINEELETFNWNDVDEYPSFDNCNNSGTKELRKQCFQTTLTNHIMSQLALRKIVVTKDLNDTINMSFSISEKGDLRVLSIEDNPNITSQIPDINTFLIESLNNLPEISPAIKRGQQVKTEFKIPIIIKVE
ncbi:hypothetical protein [Pontimicrobium aquaticum]|uniref:TonB protein C-terminal n=1 Tax=Pontimicrobium aquaticum TaxID=2565367 RepID=A0A4U0F2A0_9FLAO|nr:hypothetical protein [Pontimicrobium aquaticum]TJY37904.1 hypothetical protein E5167_01210 [Pontimicrobium aquaticum]